MRFLAVILAVILSAAPAFAADHVVRMVNEGPGGERMAFDPAYLQVAVGDTVTFVPTDNGHAVESLIVPAGAEGFDGRLNEETAVTFRTEGAVLYRSKPHFALGMIGIVVVGSPESNRAEIEAFRPRGSIMKARMNALLANF